MLCPECGMENLPLSEICKRCGAYLKAAQGDTKQKAPFIKRIVPMKTVGKPGN